MRRFTFETSPASCGGPSQPTQTVEEYRRARGNEFLDAWFCNALDQKPECFHWIYRWVYSFLRKP